MTPSKKITRTFGALALVSLLVFGCGGEDSGPIGGTGGAPAGGAVAAGGAPTASGGAPVVSGGAPGAGGLVSAGGAQAGGAPSGGAAAGGSQAGGAPSDGGTSAGGTDGSGGDATGGTDGSGGEPGVNSPCPETGACKILPLGDSITEGCCTFNGGYRVELFKQAVLAGKDITFVGTQSNGPNMVEGKAFPKNHQGHGGYKISGNMGIGGDITNNALSMFQPHIVLLMIGTNDVNEGGSNVPDVLNRLDGLLDSITSKAPDTLLVVASIIPIGNGNNQKAISYNAGLKEAVEERAAAGKKILFVDNYKVIESQPNYSQTVMAESLHPNDAGYKLLGQSFYDAIESYLR